MLEKEGIAVDQSVKLTTEAPNQQITPEKLGWIAGIVDGEGTMGVYPRRHRKTVQYKPLLSVAITDERGIRRLVEYAEWVGVEPHLATQAAASPNHKDLWKVQIQSSLSIEAFLKPILPHLVIKADQAYLLLRFIDRRVKLGRGRYDEEDTAIVEKLASLKRDGGISETTRVAPSVKKDEDIVQAA